MRVAANRLVPVHNGLREVRGAPREQQRRLCRDNQFALRNRNISTVRTNPDAHVPVAGVLLKNVLNVVSGEAERVRHSRTVMNSHSHFPAELCAAASARGKVGTAEPTQSPKFFEHASKCLGLRAAVDSIYSVPCGGTRA